MQHPSKHRVVQARADYSGGGSGASDPWCYEHAHESIAMAALVHSIPSGDKDRC